LSTNLKAYVVVNQLNKEFYKNKKI